MEIKTHRSIDMAATGRNILRLRKSRGYSVSDIQAYFGFAAPQAIYKWEKGQCLPSTDNLYDLSFLLGVPMEEILVAREYEIKSEPRESRGSGRFGLYFSRNKQRRVGNAILILIIIENNKILLFAKIESYFYALNQIF